MLEKHKRFITKLLLLTMVVNFILPSIADASDMVYMTYKQLIKQIEFDTGTEWNRPTPLITATVKGESVTVDSSENPRDETGEEWFTSKDHIPEPHIKASVGDKIDLSSSSSLVGSGSKISEWDWQIYDSDSVSNKPSKTSTTSTTSFTPTKPGIYRVYLNVADDLNVSLPEPEYVGAKFTNWSDLGNFKAKHEDGTRIIKNGKDELNIKDWYFTMMVVEVTGAIDLLTSSITPMPETVTGKDAVIRGVYSIEGVTS